MCQHCRRVGIGQWLYRGQSLPSCSSHPKEGICFPLLETSSSTVQKTKPLPGYRELASWIEAPLKSTLHTEARRIFLKQVKAYHSLPRSSPKASYNSQTKISRPCFHSNLAYPDTQSRSGLPVATPTVLFLVPP